MATISDEADKISVKKVVLETPTNRSLRVVGNEYTPGAGSAEIIVSQEELETIVRALVAMELFANPQVISNHGDNTALERWYKIRKLVEDLANVEWELK